MAKSRHNTRKPIPYVDLYVDRIGYNSKPINEYGIISDRMLKNQVTLPTNETNFAFYDLA